MNSALDLQFVFPEVILLVCALGSLMGGVMAPRKKLLGFLALLGIVSAGLLLPLSSQAGSMFFSRMLVNDPFSVFFRQLLLIISGLVVLLSMGYEGLENEDSGEYYFFLLLMTISMMLAVSSTHLLLMYIALETVSIISYLVAGYDKRDKYSSEAGIKYFIFGALSTGILLYGVTLIYGLFGTLDLTVIVQHLPAAGTPQQGAFFLALLLIFAGLGFKCSLVPFHMWTPDVYQGAPTPVAAFFSIGPKAMGFALLLRVFTQHFSWGTFNGTTAALVIAALTMTVGNIMALTQTHIKRLLGYSTIAQAGYIFAGAALGTAAGNQAVLIYLFIYTVMNVGAFGAVIALGNTQKSRYIEDYVGLYKRDPVTAVALTVCLLSLAGIPPLAGFLAKFTILAAIVDAKHIPLAVVLVINSVVALYYYARLIKNMFFEEPSSPSPLPSKPPALQVLLILCVLANIFIGLWPQPLIDWLTCLFLPSN
ncbi:MAG TPA: NADH-quinone oxidoreductase subunit N [Candidatus Omnitrophica bacterium]|nr:MAG: hypothetical protein A2Z81_03975 [Omnitrophica WOR_2 bacterium GWA2_45_18]HBR14785.1 NADH-quinone oxidoreductase subunit N [Candidatus Omnitrophota bacterium]